MGVLATVAPWLGYEGSKTVAVIAVSAAAVMAAVARRMAPRGLCARCAQFMSEPGDRCVDCQADDFYRACAPLVGADYPPGEEAL